MKKTLKIASLVVLAGLGTASLGSCKKTEKIKASGDIDVSINYKGTVQSGVSYNGTTTKTLTSGVTLQKGDITPTWKCFGEKLTALSGNTVTIREGNDYSTKEYKNDWANYNTKGFVSPTGEQLDLVMGDSNMYTTAVNSGNLTSIDDKLDSMPNFKKWVDNHEAIWNSMKSNDGHVYFTPYFDGLDSIEEMQVMNTKFVELLLDTNDGFDTATTITSVYTPTVKETADQEVTVGTGDNKNVAPKKVTVHITEANNAVAKQNALTTKNGATLVQALKEALIAEYGDNLAKSAGGRAEGDAVIWNKLSELFTGVKATYTTDDMVALLRCVKANPVKLTGKQQEMNPLVPRTAEGKRTIKLNSLIAWWGHKGMDSENGKLFFDEDGTLQDARTQAGTYDGLEELGKLYQEGLFVKNYTQDSKGTAGGKTEFRSAMMMNGTAFMLYDYNATSSVYNHDAGQAGNTNENFNYQPVLAPIVKWSSKDLNYKGVNLKDKYFRFSESNRTLKSGGWAIPTTSDNVDSALALMDYMFTEEGARIQDFGPDDGHYWTAGKLDGFADDQPIINADLLNDVNTNGTYTWNDYYRIYIGSTQGIGHVRHDALDMQVTLGQSAKAGIANVKAAISADVEILVQSSVNTANTSRFFQSVPTNIPLNADEETKAAGDAVKGFTKIWNTSDAEPACIKYVMVGDKALDVENGFKSRAEMEAAFDACNLNYLASYRHEVKSVLGK
ncbi:MAG: hypothetical protein K6G28_03795 [Acholeplasmatales bacterium]|nr:hypothetical protein [Acholeplasmatales bacterium]